MIKSISIENFRCFHKTDIKGLKRINLIGGQNNVGKTTLLEAILLAINPSDKSIIFVQQKLRSDYGNIVLPELTWQSLFFNFNRNEEINIMVSTAGATFGARFAVKDVKKKPRMVSYDDLNADETLLKVEDNTTEDETVQSSLICYKIQPGSGTSPAMRLEANKGKLKFGVSGGLPPSIFFVTFIPAGFKPLPSAMADDFERLRYRGQDGVILSVVKIIDPSIDRVEVFSFGSKKIHLQRKGQPFIPITMFGDAINKVVNITLKIANSQNGIILIDEIENGIHYTHQQEFWSLLFKVARQFNVQIFSTSHSLEMIRSFNKTAEDEDFIDDAQYIEMFRSARSGEIVGNMISHDTLAYSLVNNQTFRGE